MSEFNPLLLTAFVSKDAARQALTSSTNDWGAWPSDTHGTVPGVSGSDLGSLALAYCNEQFWFVYAMSDDGPGNVATKIFMASTANGKHWTVPTQPIANVVGDAGPAVASIDGALFVVWKSFGISYAGMAPQGAPEFQLGSEQWPINLPDEGPGEYGGGMSAVGCQGQHIVGYVAGGAAYVAAGPPGATSWGVPRSLGVATSAPPALATDGETLWAAVLDQSAVTAGGPAPVVVLASGPDAKGWERVSASPQVSTTTGPALAVFTGLLCLVHVDPNLDELFITISGTGRASWSDSFPINQTTTAMPALCAGWSDIYPVHGPVRPGRP